MRILSGGVDSVLVFDGLLPVIWSDVNGRVVEETVTWFQDESDTSLNSNVYEIAQQLVQKHFPGECTHIFSSSFALCTLFGLALTQLLRASRSFQASSAARDSCKKPSTRFCG